MKWHKFPDEKPEVGSIILVYHDGIYEVFQIWESDDYSCGEVNKVFTQEGLRIFNELCWCLLGTNEGCLLEEVEGPRES